MSRFKRYQMKPHRKSSRKATQGKLAMRDPSEYHPAFLPKPKMENQGMLLLPALKKSALPLDVAVPTVEEAVQGIHDVLVFARRPHAHIKVLCRSLNYLL